MHIYQKAEAYPTTHKPVRATPITRNSKSIREASNGLKQAVMLTIGCIAVVSWGIALSALVG